MEKWSRFGLRSLLICTAVCAILFAAANEYVRRRPRRLSLDEEALVDVGMSQDEVINLIGYPFAKFDMTQAERTELFGSAVTKVDATWWKYRVEGDILLVGFADDKVVKLDGITGCEFFD